MTAQDAKARKNAKARREKKKSDGGSRDSVSVRSDRGGASVSGPKGSFVERIVRYWRGVFAETKRVSWPSKTELVAGTITSVVILMVFAGWLGGIDLLLRKLFG
jgi:preprotein translocase SecE subunit